MDVKLELDKETVILSSGAGKSGEMAERGWVIGVLGLLLLVVFLVSCNVGRYVIPLPDLFRMVVAKLAGARETGPPALETILFAVRLPRVLAAMLIGGALAVAGATYQGLFKNPMVSPDILGASAGAGFGAAVAILFSFSIAGVQVLSFVCGIGAVGLTYLISKTIGRNSGALLVLVLAGMVVSTLFAAFTSLTKYVADPDNKLPAITFWLMGGLAAIDAKTVKVVLAPLLLGIIPLMLLRWNLNVLSFGEEEAKALGINTGKLRVILIFCATLLTAAAVSISGMIGWIGLIIPHLARMIVGPNYKVLLPAALLMGMTFLLAVDDLARSVFTIEIPLGILTALFGAPFFIYLLVKGRKGWV